MEKNRDSALDLLRNIVGSIFNGIATFVLLSTFMKDNSLSIIGLSVGVSVVQSLLSAISWYKKVFYIKDNMLFYITGLFNTKILEIPLENIMGIDIKENFFEKLFYLRTLVIDRGIEGEQDIVLILKKDKAFGFRNLLLQGKEKTDTKEQTNENIIYKIANKDLLLYALLGGSLWQVIPFLIGAVLFLSELGIAGDMMIETALIPLFLMIALIVIKLFQFGFNIIKFYGFTVTQKGDVLEVATGFFNRKISSIHTEHICSVKTVSTPIQRHLRKMSVSVNTLGYNDEFGESAVILPMSDETFAKELIRNLFPSFVFTGEKHRIDRRYKLRYKYARLGFDKSLIYLSGGILKHKTSTVSVREVDCITSVQYPWQKAQGVCKLKIRYKSMKLSDPKKIKGVKLEHLGEIKILILD